MSMKKTHILLCLLTILFAQWCIGTKTYAMPNNLHLVFDRPELETKIAKKFRVCPELHASASGQFSADELPKILRAIPAKDIWIVDLRQESHGFIDGLPVSWVTDRNAANKDKTAAEITKIEKDLLSNVRKQRAVTVFNLKKFADGKVGVQIPLVMLPDSVENEQQLVTSFAAKYIRFYVLDHHKPSDNEVNNFVNFIKFKVKERDWLHLHCRGGGGRSSTFFAMYDIIHNAHTMSLKAILERQAQLGNIKLDVMPTDNDKLWKSGPAKERYEFLCKFYRYVRDPQGYKERSFSDWQKLQSHRL